MSSKQNTRQDNDDSAMARALPATRFSRFSGNIDEKGVIKGSITSFENVDSYGDVMESTVLDQWMKENDSVVGLWSHNRAEIIGRWQKFYKRDGKVHAELHLQEGIQRAEEAITLVKNNLLEGISIGFVPLEWSYEKREDGFVGINFKKIELREISLVLEPANPMAEITDLKNSDGQPDPIKIERFLASAATDLTRQQALAIVNPYISSLKKGRADKSGADEVDLLKRIADQVVARDGIEKDALKNIALMLSETMENGWDVRPHE